MDFDEILGLEDIDADEMVLVVGGGTLVVHTSHGDVANQVGIPADCPGIANAIEAGAPFEFFAY